MNACWFSWFLTDLYQGTFTIGAILFLFYCCLYLPSITPLIIFPKSCEVCVAAPTTPTILATMAPEAVGSSTPHLTSRDGDWIVWHGRGGAPTNLCYISGNERVIGHRTPHTYIGYQITWFMRRGKQSSWYLCLMQGIFIHLFLHIFYHFICIHYLKLLMWEPNFGQ